MLFLLSLLSASIFVLAFHKLLKKKPVVFYLIAVLITVFTVLIDMVNVPTWLEHSFVGMFKRGTFSTALWVIIMFTGALKNGSKTIKVLMPIRGELSIFAAIITLGHNIVFGKVYFVNFFTNRAKMSITQIIATIITLIMLAILIPLTITSFKSIRKRMKAKNWKKLQRFAYLYYGLLYVHIMLVTYPSVLLGKMNSAISVVVYSTVFLFYFVWRVRKYFIVKKKKNNRNTLIGAFIVLILGIIVCISLVLPHVFSNENEIKDGNVSEPVLEENSEIEESFYVNLDNAEIFEGSAYGYDGDVFIKVFILDGKIVSITGYTEESDDFYYEIAAKKVIPSIISSQDWKVDAVSGATYSSEALMNAVQQAMKKAGLIE